ncbi:1,4-beta-xylanase [Sphingomonas parva]|uniref:1,4-beta-xylanase n=1 Tax=Sphingomonas parva TaxID=2555898 RepID=A0A4Y8ZUJ8_9SPHN|nr:1,4-beta-xylanase [Sphingomonas parva]TFI59690.1 1,4-beta-xylanase [Sphingomonas parva]
MKLRLWILLAAAALPTPAAALVQPQAPTAATRDAAADAIRGNPARWSQAEARAWYARQPWLTGANYINAGAINQLDMWQAATWNPAEIDKELGWAKQFGMNTMRVYLHDLAYEQDPAGFKRRMDEFLTIAARHGIRPMFVLFDSCWDPDPVIGPQHRPIPGVHNSGWVQSPGRADLIDPSEDAGFQRYVEDVVGTFANDRRVLAWDVWNEPDNPGGGSYNGEQLAQERTRIEQLLPRVFAWARSRKPVQPLTSGVWIGPDWSPGAPDLTPIQRTQLAESDVITFHNYEWPEAFEARLAQLRPYGRPLICTEWMARSAGSNVDTILPIARRENVGMINWGFVQGEIQTHLPWDSWERPYTLQQPVAWFHDLLRSDGTPYRAREAEIFRELRKEKSRAVAR